jgi:hypothetical protein
MASAAFVFGPAAWRPGDIRSPAIAFIFAAFVFVPAVPGGVVIIMAVGVVGISGVSIVPQPDRVTGSIVIAGIIKPCIIAIRVIITVIALVIITTGSHSFSGDAPIKSVVPSLLVYVIRVEALRVFFKEKGTVACGKAPAVTTLHKAHLVGRRLLHADHGIHLRHAGGQQRRRTLIPGLVMGVTS